MLIRLSRGVAWVVGFMNLEYRRKGPLLSNILFKARSMDQITKGVNRNIRKKRLKNLVNSGIDENLEVLLFIYFPPPTEPFFKTSLSRA